MHKSRLAVVALVGVLCVPGLALGQAVYEWEFSAFDLDTPPADIDRYIEPFDLIAGFEYQFGGDLEGGVIDPANDVVSFDFNFMGCLEQWDGVQSDMNEPVDCFWHGFGAACAPQIQMINLTDGTGIFGVVMRDFAYAANVIRYDFTVPADVGEILVWTEDNSLGARAFMHYDVYATTDTDPNALTDFTPVALNVRNGEYGITTNPGQYNSSYTHVYSCDGTPLAPQTAKLRFVFYCVSYDASDLFVDPWRGYWHPDNSPEWLACETTYPTHPLDLDGRQKPFVASNVAEIDVLEPQPLPLAFDGNGDGVVDFADYLSLEEQLLGPDNGTLSYDGRAYDTDPRDCDLDVLDFAAFQVAGV